MRKWKKMDRNGKLCKDGARVRKRAITYVIIVYVMLVFFFLGVQVCTKMRIVDGAILHRPLFSFLQTGQFLKVEKGNLLTWQQL